LRIVFVLSRFAGSPGRHISMTFPNGRLLVLHGDVRAALLMSASNIGTRNKIVEKNLHPLLLMSTKENNTS